MSIQAGLEWILLDIRTLNSPGVLVKGINDFVEGVVQFLPFIQFRMIGAELVEQLAQAFRAHIPCRKGLPQSGDQFLHFQAHILITPDKGARAFDLDIAPDATALGAAFWRLLRLLVRHISVPPTFPTRAAVSRLPPLQTFS